MRSTAYTLLFLIFVALLGCSSTHSSAKKEIKPTLSVEESRKYDYFFLAAMNQKLKENYDASLTLFEKALALNPQAGAALYQTALYYIQLKKPEKAVENLILACQDDPTNYAYQERLAELYVMVEKYEEATIQLEKMVAHFPAKQEANEVLIQLYTHMENFPKVIDVLNRMEQKYGKKEQLSIQKYKTYLQMSDYKKAFAEMESLVKEYPLDLRYLNALGNIYFENDKMELAFETYQKVLQEDPENTGAIVSLIGYYEKKGDAVTTDSLLSKLLLNPELESEMKVNILTSQLAKFEKEKKDSTYVIAFLERIVAQDRDDELIPAVYASYLLSKNKIPEAKQLLTSILEKTPDNLQVRYVLLDLATKENDYKEVIKICKPALEYQPDELRLYYYLGIAYVRDNQSEEALQMFKKGVEQIAGDDKLFKSEFYGLIGDIYATQKKNSEAFAAYDSSLVYNEKNNGALNNYAYYLSLNRKELDKAELMSFQTVQNEPENSTYLDTYAWILFEKKNYVLAKKYIEKALEFSKEKSDVILDHAGDIYFFSGEIEQAISFWKQAKEAGSESKVIQRKIDQKRYIAE